MENTLILEQEEITNEEVTQQQNNNGPQNDCFATEEIEIEEMAIDGICGVY